MATRFDYIAIGHNVEFDHDGPNESRLELTDARRESPEFLAFLRWYRAERLADIMAEINANPNAGGIL